MRLSDDEARQRFSAARVARLATVDPTSGQPHLVPIVFAVHEDQAAFAIDFKPKKSLSNLRRLRNIEANPAVSLLVDHYADDWTQLWWVRIDGRATILAPDSAAADAPRSWLTAKYPQYQEVTPPGPVVLINITNWSAWSASPRPPFPASNGQPGESGIDQE